MGNLVQNALRFSRAGGRVIVRLSATVPPPFRFALPDSPGAA